MFTYTDYLEAQKRLDSIMSNGIFEDASVCFERCKGQCCSGVNSKGVSDPSIPWHISAMVWNEHLYYTDPENSTDGVGIVCLRKDKISCNNKPLICKLHPYYPKRIAIRVEDCDFNLSISTKRKHCFDIKITEKFKKELSEYYAWLYGEFLDNRLAYILSEMPGYIPEKFSSQVAAVLIDGVQVGQSI